MAVAKVMIETNPDLELVGATDSTGEITVRNRKTGEVTTMSVGEMNQGKFKGTDSKGRETLFDVSAASQGRFTAKWPDREIVISRNASETAPPSWVPAYPGANAMAGGMRTEKDGIVKGFATAQSPDPVTKVKNFYDAKFKAAGLNVETQLNNDRDADTAVVNATNGDGTQKANAVIHTGNGRTTITLSYEGPK